MPVEIITDIEQDETYEMVQQWRVMIDAYNAEKGGDTRVLFTEAYASIEDTVRYYADEEGKPRAHFPFNFVLIERLNENSNAADFKEQIDYWMSKVPAGGVSNWVVSGFALLPTPACLKFPFRTAWQSR
jgi:alpha-glucosidase